MHIINKMFNRFFISVYSMLGEKKAKKIYRNFYFYSIFKVLITHFFPANAEGIPFQIDEFTLLVPRDSFEFYATGEYEKETLEIFLSNIHEGDCVIDAGAHIGYFSLFAAKKVGPTGSVYAFEPTPETFSLLKKNIENNGFHNIVPIQLAISDGTQQLQLQLCNSLSNSIIINNMSNAPSVMIQTISLDDFFRDTPNNIAMIKMDIEGAEERALEGMRGIIHKNSELSLICEYKPDILMKTGNNPRNFIKKLQDFGFAIKPIGEDDILFENFPQEYGINLFLHKDKS